MKAALTTIIGSFTLGASTGFFYRDELYFPTNMRLKVSVLEHNLLTRQKLNTDILDIVDPNSSKELSSKSKKVIEDYENEVSKL